MFKFCIKNYKNSYKNGLKLSGRMDRSTYFSIFFIDIIISFFLGVFLGLFREIHYVNTFMKISIYIFFSYRVIIFNILDIRRLQDMGYPGGIIFIKHMFLAGLGKFMNQIGYQDFQLLYFLFSVLFFPFFLQKSEVGPNQYGPAPKKKNDENPSEVQKISEKK